MPLVPSAVILSTDEMERISASVGGTGSIGRKTCS